MLHKKSILTSILMLVLFTTSAMAQCSQADVLAVVNKADWCPVCENNGKRAMKALKSSNEDGAVKFIGNDLTNDETKKKSAAKLKEHGLYEKMKSENSTGVVYFFDASSKELISTISVKKSNKKLTAAVRSATSD